MSWTKGSHVDNEFHQKIKSNDDGVDANKNRLLSISTSNCTWCGSNKSKNQTCIKECKRTTCRWLRPTLFGEFQDQLQWLRYIYIFYAIASRTALAFLYHTSMLINLFHFFRFIWLLLVEIWLTKFINWLCAVNFWFFSLPIIDTKQYHQRNLFDKRVTDKNVFMK